MNIDNGARRLSASNDNQAYTACNLGVEFTSPNELLFFCPLQFLKMCIFFFVLHLLDICTQLSSPQGLSMTSLGTRLKLQGCKKADSEKPFIKLGLEGEGITVQPPEKCNENFDI